MSYFDETIRHAIVAIGALAKLRQYNISSWGYTHSPRTTIEAHFKSVTPLMKGDAKINDAFVLTNYNKSIRALSARISRSDVPIETALLACLMFVCIEFLRGDVDSAIQHFKGGMSILQGHMTCRIRAVTSSATQAIHQSMIPLLNRVEFLAFTVGNDFAWEYPVPLEHCVPAPFSSLRACRDSLVHLLNLGMRFTRSMRPKKYSGTISLGDLARRGALRLQFKAWKAAFDSLLLTESHTAAEFDPSKVLLMCHLLNGIWLETGVSPRETETDRFLSEFDTIVSLAEAIQAFVNSPEQRRKCPTIFAFDMKVISSMFYVCSKCRHPLIRRRALAVLKMAGQRDGLWDSYWAGAIAEHLMRAEEKDLTRIDGSELPPEGARIHTSNASTVTENGVTKHVLTMFAKPNDLNGEWMVWKEELTVDHPLIGDSRVL